MKKINKQYNKRMDKKSPVPLIINIFRKVRFKNNKIKFSALCLFHIIRNPEKHFDTKELELTFGNLKIPIIMKYQKGLHFIKGYYLNFYSFELPLDKIIKLDIQNKILVNYKGYVGRIVYTVFDFKKGKYRNSKIIKHFDTAIYFRQTIKNTMYLTIREHNIFDEFLPRLKLKIAFILSKFIYVKNIVLLYEKEANKYEESASVLYEKLIDQGYDNCYYILDKNHEVLLSLKDNYKKNIIFKNSFKHLLLFFKCNKFIGTETIGHSIQLRIANKQVLRKLNSENMNFVFLQHGVMYMISLDSDLRTGFHRSHFKLHKTVVSSELEARHFIELGNFPKEDLYVTGLAKFDKSYKNEYANKIVIMPTWRRWESNEARLDFTKTGYHKMIADIIDSIPSNLLKHTIVLPHPLIINYFIESKSNLTKYLPEKGSYDKILQDCKLLITDYSSISYDAFYRGSNVIFYWKDKVDCLKKYGDNAKLMLNQKTAFGDICYNKDELEKSIIKRYTNEQILKYKNRFKKIVQFDDNKNSERIIRKLKEDNII